MERLIGWWVHNPVAANLLMVGLILAGFLGFLTMERESFPNIKVNQVSIQVAWPGAAPQEIEEQIIIRIEEALSDIDAVYKVQSTAVEGAASIQVSTYPNIDGNEFLIEVKNAVDAVVSMPRDIENPRVTRMEFRSEMMRIAVHGDGMSERELTRLAEDLRDEVAALPYISVVKLFGTRREEVAIELSETAMRRFDLSFAEVSNAIGASSINLSSGQVRTATGDVQLRARNMADSQEEFEKIIIRQSAAGGTVRVGDVATVIDGFEEDKILATMNGQPAVLLHLATTDTMQVVKASDAVQRWIEERRPELPAGVALSLWMDSADTYRERINLIGKSAYMGLALVFLILIVSLRPKVALWVTAGIGVAFLGTFSLLPANDVSINAMSIYAFLLVLGIVVDDAIVVGESVHHYSHRLGGGPESAIAGAYAVSRPVIFAVLTTVIAFAPWFFVSGERAQMTRQLSLVITIALGISLIEAFFILPSHLRNLTPRGELKGLARKQRQVELSIVAFANRWYRGVLVWAVERRYLTSSIFAAGLILALGLFSSGWVKFYFMPQVESDEIYIKITLPTGTPYARAMEVLDQLQVAEEALITEVNQRAKEAGGTGELIEGRYTRARRDNVVSIIKLAPPDQRDMSSKATADRFRELVGSIPDADEIEVSYTLDHSGADVTFLLRHRDSEILRAASRELQGKLRSYEGAFYVRDSQRGESDEMIFSLLPGADKLGITLAEVSQQVRQAYYGEEVQRLPRENGDVKVMVKYPSELRNNLSSLDHFQVRTTTGTQIPLLSIVDVEIASGVQRIQRRDGRRVVYVNADMNHDLMSSILKDVNAIFIPELKKRYPELDVLKGGHQEQEQEFFDEVIALYAVALFMMYALIAVAFRSYWLPLLVMTAIPFGFMGAVFGHLFYNEPMAMFSYFGIGAAAGVVVNDNLVLVDYIGRLRKEGKSVLEAVVESGVSRFRPILLTTVTTFVGLLPIMAEQATQAQYLKPAVLSLSFGVLFALFVTLRMVPALYVIGDDLRDTKDRLVRRLFPKKGAAASSNWSAE